MDITSILSLFGGLGMFLYGMHMMGNGLEKSAGDRLQKIIDALTGNLFKGILMGTAVTALIQSSSATTVMVVGFVNAGVMNLNQAVGVIMGANIGTTITSWIMSLGDLPGGTLLLAMLKPKNFAPILMIAGVAMMLFIGKKKTANNIGEILAGFGLLFIGMYTMEGSVAQLRDLPQFQAAFTAFQNPIIGVLVGAGVTALIQSSSASVGILQASAATGLVTFSSAVPIIMGQNIGTCITAILSSVGASKNAKKAAMVHLSFNLIGTVVFMTVIYLVQHFIGIAGWDDQISRVGVAQFHSMFNIANTILLIPFSGLLVKLANLFVPGEDTGKRTKHLDQRLLTTPALAISQSIKEVTGMITLARENVALTYDMLKRKDTSLYETIAENEKAVDELEAEITTYLSKIVEQPLTDNDIRIATGLFHIVNDVERIGDHASNIAELYRDAIKRNLDFTDSAMQELDKLYECTFKIIDLAIASYEMNDKDIAFKIEPLEDVIDELTVRLNNRHIRRLTAQKCSIQSGVVFLELLGNFERIADHCSNIGLAVLQQNEPDGPANPHEFEQNLHDNMGDDYKQKYEKYLERYNV